MSRPAEVISGVTLAADLDPSGPRPMLAVLDAKPEHVEDVRRLVAELAGHVRREPGCLAFLPYEEHGRPGRFYLYEVYADLEAFRTHLRTAHVVHFTETVPRFCTTDPHRALVQLDPLS